MSNLKLRIILIPLALLLAITPCHAGQSHSAQSYRQPAKKSSSKGSKAKSLTVVGKDAKVTIKSHDPKTISKAVKHALSVTFSNPGNREMSLKSIDNISISVDMSGPNTVVKTSANYTLRNAAGSNK